MKIFVVVVGISFLLMQRSYCYVWQNKDHLAAVVNKYYKDLSKIPPCEQTAEKFTRYFLNRDVSVVKHPRSRVSRSVEDSMNFTRTYDIALVIDSSGSVKQVNFERGLKALQRMVFRGLPDTNYAAITFSNHAKLEFAFTDKENARRKLKKIKYRSGKTNTQEALSMALNELIRNKTSNIRQGSVRRILLLTDGLSNVDRHLTLLRGWELKISGVEIFVMAVGRYKHGFDEIVGLASSTHAHLYRVGHMKGFLQVMKLIPVWPLDANEEKSWLSSMHERAFRLKKQKKIRIS